VDGTISGYRPGLHRASRVSPVQITSSEIWAPRRELDAIKQALAKITVDLLPTFK